MATVYNWVIDETAPVADLSSVLDYLWVDEVRSFLNAPAPDHVFRNLAAIANWLNTGATWSPEDYARWWECGNDDGWRVSGRYDKASCPNADEPSYAWEYEGAGSRYRLEGKSSGNFVILGWDSPLETFFAQVWSDLHGGHDEFGQLLHWVGTSPHELPTLESLRQSLEAFAEIPRRLAEVLEANRAGIRSESIMPRGAVTQRRA